MFNGKGSWHIPDYANFYLTTVQLSCSMYGLRSGGGNDRPEPINSRGRLLLPVIGTSGNVGYAFEEDLQPFGGASKEEMAEMVAMGYRIVDVYDADGLTVVDSFVVECAEMEVIE